MLRAVLGISGEAGEVSEVIKKYFRGDYDWDEAIRRLKKELGDVLYYVSIASDLIGSDLREIAELNIFKLFERFNENKLKGDGSDR